MKFRKLISELYRRNVFEATIAYLAVALVIIQIASIVLPVFDIPDYSLKVLIYILAIGLVFWIGFSRIYDLTSDGFQKTKDIINNEETIRLTNRRLNRVITWSLFIAVLLLISASFWAGSLWNEGLLIKDTKRVAVIPFIQKGEGKQEEYFRTGMTEALINELSKVDQLSVISQANKPALKSWFFLSL
jgi:hypothetical protein